MKLVLVFALFLYTFKLFATYEKSDAFIVDANMETYKVLSPTKISDKTSIILKNNTTEDIRGTLIKVNKANHTEHAIKNIRVLPQEPFSYEFKFSKNYKYYFVPQSPPYQRVILKEGKKAYEIPPKR